MRIGLISDTHLSHPGEDLPSAVFRALGGSDLILHAGDVYIPKVLDDLERIAPVLCARGNGDRTLNGDHRVKDAHVLVLQGRRIGLAHGLDYPEPDWRPLERAMECEFGGPVHIFIYGDTHVPVVDVHKGVLLVNPGSPTLPYGLPKPGTVGVLELGDGAPQARIIQLEW
ncbi:MAG: metallophosphoesterase family protein [Chloroflexi bacterium]|nr:metallophosphoesterase family protein [Chloroflexota bacterium]